MIKKSKHKNKTTDMNLIRLYLVARGRVPRVRHTTADNKQARTKERVFIVSTLVEVHACQRVRKAVGLVESVCT